MFYFLKYCFVLCCFTFLVACGTTDDKKIIAIWQNENDWFEIKQDSKYNTGTGPSVFFTDLNYALDAKTKEIIFYTNTASKSYTTTYFFKAADTLVLTNKMPGSKPTTFFKVKKIPNNFQ